MGNNAKYVYVDSPQQKSLADYARAIERYLEIIKDPQLVSVYQTGSISAPGFSDIDAIIILKNQLDNPARISRKIQTARRELAYFFRHEPIIVSEDDVLKLTEIYPLFDYKLIYGKKFGLRPKLNKAIACIHLINEVNTGFFTPYINALIEKDLPKFARLLPFNTNRFCRSNKITIRARHLICRLSTFKYANLLFKIVSGKDISGAKIFQKRIDWLRNNWFKLSEAERYKKMHLLLNQHIKLTANALNQMHSFFINKGLVKASGIKQAKLLMLPRIVLYDRRWAANNALEVMKSIYANYGKIVSFTPISFAVQPFLHPNARYFFDKRSYRELQQADCDYAYKQEFLEMQNRIESIASFLKENSLRGKAFSKFEVNSFGARLKRTIASWLFAGQYELE